jgi:hypothetical protein
MGAPTQRTSYSDRAAAGRRRPSPVPAFGLSPERTSAWRWRNPSREPCEAPPPPASIKLCLPKGGGCGLSTISAESPWGTAALIGEGCGVGASFHLGFRGAGRTPWPISARVECKDGWRASHAYPGWIFLPVRRTRRVQRRARSARRIAQPLRCAHRVDRLRPVRRRGDCLGARPSRVRSAGAVRSWFHAIWPLGRAGRSEALPRRPVALGAVSRACQASRRHRRGGQTP